MRPGPRRRRTGESPVQRLVRLREETAMLAEDLEEMAKVLLNVHQRVLQKNFSYFVILLLFLLLIIKFPILSNFCEKLFCFSYYYYWRFCEEQFFFPSKYNLF